MLRRLWRCFAALLLTACHGAPPKPAAPRLGVKPTAGWARTILIPNSDQLGAARCSAGEFDLRTCLAHLIETKSDDAPLTILISPGSYELRGLGGLLIFQ